MKPKIIESTQPPETKTAEKKIIEEPTSTKPTSPSAGGSVVKTAIDLKNSSKCLELGNERLIAACVTSMAQNLNDTSFCSDIKNQLEMVKCVDTVSFDRAVKDGEASKCSSIKDDELSGACVKNVINANGLSDYNCQNLPEREKAFCSEYVSYLNDAKIAKNATKEEDCNLIKGEVAKTYCLDKVFVK